MIESLNALTLATRDMKRAVRFYVALGFELEHGGEEARFTTFRVGSNHLNLIAQNHQGAWWGRAIFHVDDVDRTYALALAAGLSPTAPPRNAEWGERFFHLTDPDGHELSFAKPLS